MDKTSKYYIVEASALPEVFLKVAKAKHLLATGEASTVNEAAKMTDISRSAFYKYRDAVQPFQNMNVNQLVTFQFLLRNETGALSSILSLFAQYQANLMNVNSVTPSNGCAVVTVTAETSQINATLDEMLAVFTQNPGVIKAEVLAAG